MIILMITKMMLIDLMYFYLKNIKLNLKFQFDIKFKYFFKKFYKII